MLRNIFILTCILLNSLLSAQEIVSVLVSQPLLFEEEFKFHVKESSLELPFFDDFSYDSHVVDYNLWQNSSVFINRNYPLNPPTYGVATFDGMNEKGLARSFFPISDSEPSDTLMSRPIDLSYSNSVYFIFYYQAKGLGDTPQFQDSLVLEFLDDTLGWQSILSIEGQNMQEFKKVVLIIDSPVFLHDNFQFRFRNYATISGNFDHWHIDYVKLDNFLSSSDTSSLNDVSFVYNSPSFLKRYSEMPWTHFINNENAELKDSIDIKLRNNGASTNVDYQFNVFENNNQVFHYPTIGISRNVSVLDYDSIGNYSFIDPSINIESNVFNSFQIESTSFIVQNIIGTALSDNKFNDTLYHTQNFQFHFAYDDGTAESAYGINVNGAKLAYEFQLNRPDTLRAIQMYFPQMLYAMNNVDFHLTIWEDDNGSPGNIIYSQLVSPVHTEDGKYHSYYIDSPFQIVGTFYVGWEQTTNDLLNIGLDRNNEANSYMFYNIGSGWNMSSFPGSWMIRPVFSMNELITSDQDISLEIKTYPNPVDSEFFIENSQQDDIISLYSLQGILISRLVVDSNLPKIDVHDLPRGVYILEVLDKNIKKYQKIVIK